ncbi:nucleolar complex protein 2 homolog [Oryza brachyantha]|uniref:Nucleolar complex protein 2 homolog n=1 Tax=Oryza brachyantha TaxID=4533 RepID=J3NBM5_ORYBR|nr:nucleolar complex protein 2 homolog [Oryza brachyantha]
MAKKLGKKARKFARKHLQSAAKRNRKQRSQFVRRPRRGGGGRGDDRSGGDGDEEMPRRAEHNVMNNDDAETLVSGLEFPEDEGELNSDLSDSDGYLSEDSECPYYSDSEGDNVVSDSVVQDGLDGENDKMNTEIKKQKKKLNKLMDKDPKFANYLEKWQSELKSYRSKEDSDDDEMDSVDSDADFSDKIPPNDKILTRKTISEWCQLVAKEPKAPSLRSLLNAYRDACRFGVNSKSPSVQRIRSTEVFYHIITFVLSEADNIFRALLEISDDVNKGKIMNLRSAKKWQTIEPLIKSYLQNSLDLLSQLTDNQILAFVLTRLRASAVLFSAYPSASRRLLKILIRLWASGDHDLSLSSFLMIREVSSLLPESLDLCLNKSYNAYLASSKLVNDRNIHHIDFLTDCLVELYSLDVQKSCERATTSIEQLNAILRQASKTKEKEDLRKVDNWQYINCVNLWVRFLRCNYKDYNMHPLLSSVVQIIRGVAHLFPGTRYLPLRLRLVQMLNELSGCSQMFFPIPSLLFDCLEFGDISQKEQGQKAKVNFSSLLKVPKNLLKSRDFHEECILSAIDVLSSHFAQWCYHVSFPEVATIPLILLKRLHEQTTIESLRRPIKRLIDQVDENKNLVERKRDGVSFSPNDKTSVESFVQDLQADKSSGKISQFYKNVPKKFLR